MIDERQRRVCVVTGSRAEYGLLYWVLHDLRDDPAFELQLVVTGMHLVHEHGHTVDEIERDGFPIDRKVDMLVAGDSPAAVARSIGLGVIGIADALEQLRPEIVARPRRPLRDFRRRAGVPRPQRPARPHRRR